MRYTRKHVYLLLLSIAVSALLFKSYTEVTTIEDSEDFYLETLQAGNSGAHASLAEEAHVEYLVRLFNETQHYHLANVNTTGKFIIYYPAATTGLGNRIPPMLSALILSLIVGRGFLVYWPEEGVTTNTEEEVMSMIPFKDLFDPPIILDATLVPDFNYFSADEVLALRFNELGPASTELLLCQDIDALFKEKRFLFTRGNKGFLDILMQNEIYAQKRKDLGLTPKMVKKFGQRMFPPAKEVKSMVDSFVLAHPVVNSHPIVGVHIRALSNHSVSPEGQLELWQYIAEKYPANSSFYYFLASDSNSTLQNVPQEIQPFLLFQNSADLTRVTKAGIQNALADILLLGKTREIFGGKKTTFLLSVQALYEVPVTRKVGTYNTKLDTFPCFLNWKAAKFHLSCNNTLEELVC
eukprot:Phypoly_transcript_09922.p1 GENE.Phypoly_transcript_09922~~Phypoly_transcript_09922.p1  ORF type:complete len:409 (+),score=48.81 Phypoly_transcript_09922:33-1259(+)